MHFPKLMQNTTVVRGIEVDGQLALSGGSAGQKKGFENFGAVICSTTSGSPREESAESDICECQGA